MGYIVLKIFIGLAASTWKKVHPAPPPLPTVSFGKIPKIAFPNQEWPRELEFKLETIQGQLPTVENVARVYLMPKTTPTFFALTQAKDRAKKMGFTGEPELIGKNTYRWRSATEPPTTLEMDILTNSFRLSYPYQTDQSILEPKNLPNTQQASQETKTFLNNNGLLGEDLSSGQAGARYLRWESSELVPALSLSEADFISVNLFRADIDNYKILPPNPPKSLVYFLFSGDRTPGKRILEIEYNHTPIDKQIYGTYPLKPIATAWQELKEGKGFIARLDQKEDKQVTVRKVSLAYFDSPSTQDYLQPIFVFEGDKNFLGYVPAIDPIWLE